MKAAAAESIRNLPSKMGALRRQAKNAPFESAPDLEDGHAAYEAAKQFLSPGIFTIAAFLL